jgi:hypothetical protein
LIRAWIGPEWEQSVRRHANCSRVSSVLRRVIRDANDDAAGHAASQIRGSRLTRFAALANLVPAFRWYQIWGSVGVAFGTIIPVLICAAIIFRKAARRLKQGRWQGVRQIVWPTVVARAGRVSRCTPGP